jgi:hypothetical protein
MIINLTRIDPDILGHPLTATLHVFRVQLGVCISQIVKHDFPGKWPQIVEKISIYLQTPDPAGQPRVLF